MTQKQEIAQDPRHFTSKETNPSQTSVEWKQPFKEAKTTAPSLNFNEQLLTEMPSCAGVTGQ